MFFDRTCVKLCSPLFKPGTYDNLDYSSVKANKNTSKKCVWLRHNHTITNVSEDKTKKMQTLSLEATKGSHNRP